jgi:hypothetical protein
MDEASIYNRALSASEIKAIYNAGSAGKYPLPNPHQPRRWIPTRTAFRIIGR